MQTKTNRLLSAALFSGLGLFSYLLLVNYTDLPDKVSDVLNSLRAFLFFMGAFNVVGYATVELSRWLNKQYTVHVRKRWKFVIGYMAVVWMFLLLNLGLLVTGKVLAGVSSPFLFSSGGIRILIVVWLVELLILGLLLANNSMLNTLRLQKQAAELQEENDKARYIALQNQLNPHFLFNSLNTLVAEIEYNPQNAIGFTKNLSNVYRYVLQCQDKPLVTLAEELAFVHSYMFLHEVRLGDCIRWHSAIPEEEMDCILPPLTLQLLIENVIKHNSITPARPMVVSIGMEGELLVIRNPVNPKKNVDVSGVGLRNLSNRYKLIVGKDINVVNSGTVFTVKVPLLYE